MRKGTGKSKRSEKHRISAASSSPVESGFTRFEDDRVYVVLVVVLYIGDHVEIPT